ncbi:nucleoporin NUP42 [Corythoichthys intestinalis]|uniref:nucleoporin NUP42 n=1 Tax=Corythoichthys intestinalis TaxID=161448 RepID=UPI0025A5B6B3|nr:nucleoporin NUP42 [Corythoichthys intestinalis]XP_061808162.1 nucleoporin NUP42 [Nerophis lumbriciformis]
MTVCNFFLQGRCRYGEKCWNEHPRGGGGGGGGGYNNYNRNSAPQHSRGGGFGNKVWINPSQQKGGFNQQQSQRVNDHWGGRGQDVKSSEFSFSSQNRFSALNNQNNFDRGGRGGLGRETTGAGEDDDEHKLETIQSDMKTWESSGQWGFSCYSNFKAQLSGFTDLSPEELRLEYYSTKASGDLQSYLNGVNLLLSQWRSRVQDLLIMNPATRAALLAELKNPAHQASSSAFGSTSDGFGSSSFGFGSQGFGAAPVQASTFSFAAPAGGFGSSPAPASAPSFGGAISAPAGFGAPSSFSGFGSAAPSAASFSFTSSSSSQPPASASGFGSASGFSFSSTATNSNNNNKVAFGSTFGSVAPTGSLFGQSSATAASAGGASDSLFSANSELTPEELEQFKAQRFTLGQIPLKPPPAEMLRV